ncbi:branched-chain amino acid ABC transporter permease [Alphaproteobacteria bacterium]|nr:branched-chain amino acid ABC transporter permease [Alphaproteobacteria bacterium]
MEFQLLIEQLLNGLQFGTMLFLMSSGLTLVFGVMGLINLAHGSFYMIGAFGAAFLAEITGSFFIGLISSFIVAMFAGVITEILVIRKLYKKDHLDQVLATFALILIFSEGIRWIFGAYPLYLNIPSELNASVSLPLEIIYSKYRLLIIAIGILIAFFLYILTSKTLLGIRIKAGQNDREMISVLGVNIKTLYTIVFALGAALAGLSGALIGAIQSVEVGMGEPVLILAFVVIIIGGIGSIKGAFVGALLVGVTDTLGRFLLPELFKLFFDNADANLIGSSIASMSIYILMAIVLIFKPSGLFGERLA